MEGLVWGDIVKIALGSGVVTAFFSFLFGLLRDSLQARKQRRIDGEIDAIHLISKLDALAAQCAHNYWSFHDLWSQLRGTGHENSAGGCDRPEINITPQELAKIDRKIACRIAWLENDIKRGNDRIQARWETYLDSDDAILASADLVGYFGYEALLISKQLRAEYGLSYSGPKWGLEMIEEVLKRCSESSKKFLNDND